MLALPTVIVPLSSLTIPLDYGLADRVMVSSTVGVPCAYRSNGRSNGGSNPNGGGQAASVAP
ncbi:MAG: hypothetical protein ACI8PT_001223 [Gammaproteobacteria bacterium]|jgi:hypothetical protein